MAVALASVLGACQLGQGGRQQTLQRTMVVADEPQAAIAGRETLDAGGNAIDAAVAMGLTLGVTLPSRAGFGGGGACLVHEPGGRDETGRRVDGVVRALDFLPAPAGDAAAPGTVRGLFALHADYGRLRWAELVRPAEMAARFGHTVSRALARDLASAEGAEAAAALPVLAGPDGAPRGEGARLVQGDLADTLAAIRNDGPAAFYAGGLGRRISEGAAAAGSSLPRDALIGYAPRWIDAPAFEVGNDALYFMPGAGSGGDLLAALWPALDTGDFDDREPAGRGAALVEAWRQAAGGGRSVAPGATVVAVDSASRAVVCGFSMGRLFGAGLPAGDTGLLLSPAAPGVDQWIGGLAMAINHPTNSPLVIGGGSGAVSAAAMPTAAALLGDADAAGAVRTPRAEPAPGGGGILAEPGAAAAVGGAARTVEALGVGAAVICVRPPNRGPRDMTVTCTAVADPRGAGLARGEEFLY